MCVCVCVCVCVCERERVIQYYDCIIYYFLGFTVYTIIDLGKCSVVTLVVRYGTIEMTAIIIIVVKINKTFESKIFGF